MTVNEMIQKIRNPDNWTDAFFSEIFDLYIDHYKTVRNTLVKDGLWDRFDTAISEWKKPGQVCLFENKSNAVCDNGAARALIEHNLSMETIDNINEEDPRWLITDYIPRGQITALAGDGGVGKTTVWCAIAAAVSSGKQCFMLNGGVPEEFSECNPEKVMFFSSEDSVEITLRRRLRINGANLKNIFTIPISDERFEKVKFNSPFLEQLIAKHRPSLVVFDPIQGFIPANMKMGERNAMRSCLSPLIGYGEKYGCSFLIIVHSNKQSNVWGRKRIADSSDIWDSARSVLLMGETNDRGIRYISHEKSNYGIPGDTVLYSIDNEVVMSQGYTSKKDKDFVSEIDFNTRLAPQRSEAKEFILDYLKDGEKEVCELDEAAKAMSISKNTLGRAKSELKQDGKIKYRTVSLGKGKGAKHYMGLI